MELCRRAGVVMFGAAAAGASALAQPVATFAPQQTFAEPGRVWSVAAGDLNGDGYPELAAGSETHSLSLRIGAGVSAPGEFGPPTVYLPAGLPTGVAIADLNGDGIPDLVELNSLSSGVSGVGVWFGRGGPDRGTLIAGPTYPIYGMPTAVLVHDFNGDGRPDLAVTSWHGEGVAVLLNNAAPNQGTFQTSRPYVTPGSDVTSVVSGDFDGDGIPDLIVTAEGFPTAAVLLGQASPRGTFRSGGIINGRYSSDAALTSDFNHDGKLDLAIADIFGGRLVVYVGDPHPGNPNFVMHSAYPLGVQPIGLAIADFDGDGELDLAAANYGSDTVSILLGVRGSSRLFRDGGTLASPGQPRSIAAADFNGDGRPDLAVAHLRTRDAALMLNTTCGGDYNSDGFVDFFDYHAFLSAFQGEGADFNRDGTSDFFDYDDFVAAFEAGC